MEWDFFFTQLEAGISIDETWFYFKDNPDKNEHYLGYLSPYEKPYWVGYCDVKDGCEFGNATELVDAPIFDGKSLREQGCCLEDWLMYFQHR